MFAAVNPEEFAAKSAVVTDRIAKAAEVHPLVKAAFKDAPKSLTEVAQRYAQLLAKYDKAERCPTPTRNRCVR